MKIAIDAGHGGGDTGASFQGVHEKDIVLLIALALEKILLKMEHEAFLLRDWDYFIPLGDRAEMANAWEADVIISLHCNADADDDSDETLQGKGEEIWIKPGDDRSRHLAETLMEYVDAAIPDSRFRGIKEANFAILRRAKMPGVLIELGFLDNTKEIERLSNPGDIIKIAKLIAAGVGEYDRRLSYG